MASEYHDRLWEEVPGDRALPHWGERLAFVLGEIQPGWRVLDLGCGDGRFSAEIAAAGAEVVGLDVSAEAIARARRRSPGLDFRVVEPGARLPLDDGELDCVFTSHVICQVVDVAGFMGEVRRVLKPGGRLLLTTHCHGRVKDALAALRSFDARFAPLSPQVRFFTKRTLKDLAASFGFEQIDVRAVGGPPLFREQIFLGAVRGTYRVLTPGGQWTPPSSL